MKQTLFLLLTFLFCITQSANAQNKLNISAEFQPELNTVTIKQGITITNTTNKPLDSIYLYDWNNSYSSRETELAKRFAEEYSTKLHFSKEKERGSTTIKAFHLILQN